MNATDELLTAQRGKQTLILLVVTNSSTVPDGRIVRKNGVGEGCDNVKLESRCFAELDADRCGVRSRFPPFGDAKISESDDKATWLCETAIRQDT